jgi:hypothetical protein
MDSIRFDRWTRGLSATSSRRQTLVALLSAFTARFATEEAAAGPGCKNIGKKCKKKKDCCSGICRGKKGKKKCKAHNTGGCQSGQQSGVCGGADVPCTSSAGEAGRCETTTGNAGYCSSSGFQCTDCADDADCRAWCGSDAACIHCPGCGTSLTACVGPQDCEL